VGRAAYNGRPAHGTNFLNGRKNKHAGARRASNGLLVLVARLFSRGFDRVPSWSARMRSQMGVKGPPQPPQEKDACVSPDRERARSEPLPNASPDGRRLSSLCLPASACPPDLPEVSLAFAPGEGARARRGNVSRMYRLARIG
jgi:hypothetical protein